MVTTSEARPSPDLPANESAPTPTPSPPPLPAPVPGRTPALAHLAGPARAWALVTQKIDFTHPDAIDDQLLNHAIWYADKGFTVPYPGESRVLLPNEVSTVVNRFGAGED